MEVQRNFHLVDKMLVPTACFVGRNERMREIKESGSALILSTGLCSEVESLGRFRIAIDGRFGGSVTLMRR